MNELAPTKQQREIVENLKDTLGTFDPANTLYTDGPAPQAPPAAARTRGR
jgi:hypothetical protein